MEVEGAGGAESNVYFEEGAGVDFANNGDAMLLDGFKRAMKDIAGAEAYGPIKREENIAGADGDADVVSGFCVTEGHFDRSG